MGPAESINLVEVALRDLIEYVLAGKFGPDEWINECGTPEKVERWRERRTEEGKRRDSIVAEDRLLYFSDFSDLAPIIKKHWELFKPCFGDRKTFDVYMDRLEESRNPPMHARSLVPFERALVEGMTGEIRNKVTIYRSEATAVDQHFPRIEFARDSFGHAGRSGGLAHTSLILHPDDEVVYECAGCDPMGHTLKWTMTVLPGGESQQSEGPEVRFEWIVTEDNISALTFVSLKLISDRSWHRHAGCDDEVNFGYAVLPRRTP
jgi:hypothetical protein